MLANIWLSSSTALSKSAAAPVAWRTSRLQKEEGKSKLAPTSSTVQKAQSNHPTVQKLNTVRTCPATLSVITAIFPYNLASSAPQVLIQPSHANKFLHASCCMVWNPRKERTAHLCHQWVLLILLATPPTTMMLIEVRDVSEAKLITKGTMKSSGDVFSGVAAGRLAADGVVAKGRGI